MRIHNKDLLEATGPIDMDADFTLQPIYLGHIAQYAIQLFFSATPDGTFTLECSNDPGHPNAAKKEEQYEDVDHWTTIAGSASIVSADGDITWNAENVGYLWVRVKWVANAAGGSLDSAKINVKGV